MYVETELVFVFILGLVFGVLLMILTFLPKESVAEQVNSSLSAPNYDDKEMAPFIKINQSFIEETNATLKDESLKRLKEKVESFKLRNRFYQG